MPGASLLDDGVSHPDRIGRYVLLLPIASGGMGVVYLARTRGIGGFERDVALKLSHTHLKSPEFTIALLDEAVLAGGIRHPNVVSILDVGEDPHGLYVVMEYVEGDSIAGLARLARKAGQKLPLPVALRMMDDALAGLHAAHELEDADGRKVGLVHRDFSPQNILVGIDGLAKLTDFGVAKALGRLSHTASGAIKGKVAYMSPEQARGGELDRRVDVWAAGVLTWELLTGTRLYRGVPDAVALLKIVSEVPPRARHVNPDVPHELDEVVARALEPDIEKRLQTADLFARELSSAARASVGLAERREVAELVKGLVSESLDSRRQKVKRIVELKEQMGLLVRLPERRARDRASFGEGSQDSSSDVTSVPSVPVVSAPEDSAQTDTLALTSTQNRSRVGKVLTRPKVAGLTLGGLLVAVALAFGVRVLFAGPEPTAELAHISWHRLPSVSVPASSAPALDERPSVKISIRADALVKELRVDGDAHPIAPPSKKFQIDVPREPGTSAKVEAVSVDGRKTTAKLASGTTLVTLRFPVVPKEPEKGPRKLLPSPYGH
jgi:serine/threonine protein kinase